MNDIADLLGDIGTSASKMLLSFFGLHSASDAKREGTKRRVKREDKKRADVAALYANAPGHPPSRQVLRAERRATAKEATRIGLVRLGKKSTMMRRTNWPWREVERALRPEVTA